MLEYYKHIITCYIIGYYNNSQYIKALHYNYSRFTYYNIHVLYTHTLTFMLYAEFRIGDFNCVTIIVKSIIFIRPM